MKWMGSVLLILTGTGIGIAGWLRLQRRVDALQLFLQLINRLSERIRYTTAPLATLLRSLSQTAELRDFSLLHISFDTDEDMRCQWVSAVEKQGAEWGFSEDDRVLMKAFIGELGKTDAEGEMRFCEEYGALVQTHLAQARDEWKAKGRLYVTLGICSGLAAALLLW